MDSRLVQGQHKESHQGKLQSQMISLLAVSHRRLHIQLLEDHKLKRQLLEEVQLDQAVLTQPVRLAINLQVPLQGQAIQAKRRQEAPLAINHPLHPNIQALKALTQVPELPFHLPMCHHPTNLLKDSHHSPTLLIQLRQLHKRQLENICHQEEVKRM